MANTNTTIEWTDATWSPVTGCTKVSPGCKNCYAEAIANRFWGDRKFSEVRCHEDRLDTPLHWKKPRRVFVNSMSDLFHEDVPDEFIDKVFAVMALCPQHTFQVLTKRPEKMREYMTKEIQDRFGQVSSSTRIGGLMIARMAGKPGYPKAKELSFRMLDAETLKGSDLEGLESYWPLPHVHLGVSVEDQQRADERIPLLLQTPAAVRFLSCEPLLGAIDLWHHLGISPNHDDLRGLLNWLIVGGESGPKARPCNLAWIRSIVRQCKAAGVPVFVKQLGSKPFTEGQPLGIARYGMVLRSSGGFADPKGGNPAEWPDDLRVREYPR